MNDTVLNETASEIPPADFVIELSYTMLITFGNIVFTLLFLCYQYGCINLYEFLTFFTTSKLHPFESKLPANKICITEDKSVYFGEVGPNLILKTGKYIEFLENNQEVWARRTGAQAYLQKVSLKLIPLGFTYRIRRRLKALHKYGMETKLIYWNKFNLFLQSRIICQGMVCCIGYAQVAIMDAKTEKRRKTSALISHLKLPTFEIECPADLKDWVKHLVASTDALNKEEREVAEALKEMPDKLSPFLVPGDSDGPKRGSKVLLEKDDKSRDDSKTTSKPKRNPSPKSTKTSKESTPIIKEKSNANTKFKQKTEICEQRTNILFTPPK